MSYRNICFSCHAYIGYHILDILKDVESLQKDDTNTGAVTPVIDLMELADSRSFVRDWLDERKITKLCCRDAIRDAANMKEFDRKTNLNKL